MLVCCKDICSFKTGASCEEPLSLPDLTSLFPLLPFEFPFFSLTGTQKLASGELELGLAEMLLPQARLFGIHRQ